MIAALAFALAVAATPALAAPTGPAKALPTSELRINGHKLVVEIAATPASRETGLMNRFSLQPDHGMLFVFERAEPLSFWMHNTYVALSIAFVDDAGRILNIEDMAPQTDATHGSRGAGRYAIEMRKGWFAEHAIRAGDKVDGLPVPPK